MSAKQDLLFELGCEELPAQYLKALSLQLSNNLSQLLSKAQLSHDDIQVFATPRRLALLIPQLQSKQADQRVSRRGPSVQAAFDNDHNPTAAALGFAKSCQTTVDQLEQVETDKGPWLYYNATQSGKTVAELLPELIQLALKQLPIAKAMRWGDSNTPFLRPVHWAVLLYGDQVIQTHLFGVMTDRYTYGHRFHSDNTPIAIEQANQYDAILRQNHVIANFDERKAHIHQQLQTIPNVFHAVARRARNRAAQCTGQYMSSEISAQQSYSLKDEGYDGQVDITPDLLDEVTALVEWPVALLGHFDDEFLTVPKEALISAMRGHQKCFAVLNTQDKNKILPHFVTISNIDSKDPATVIAGNEKVIQARLADAAFFYQTDCKTTLDKQANKLKTVTFQAQLGSVYDRCTRLSQLCADITAVIEPDFSQTEIDSASRAGLLSKADLATEMVLEFPELQGIMGYYYALNDQEPADIAIALKEQYLPKFSGDILPKTTLGQALALADKVDLLSGIFSTGQIPTGDKDPFALKRAAQGLLRILIEKKLSLDLKALIANSLKLYSADNSLQTAVFDFITERLHAYYSEQNIAVDCQEAVLSLGLADLYDIDLRMQAVHLFRKLDSAATLAAANKRVQNILNKTEFSLANANNLNQDLLTQDEEKTLYQAISDKQVEIKPLLAECDYNQVLESLAGLKPSVDAFFDGVMVMADDENLKNNRLALLAQLRQLFLQVADISHLQGA